MCLSLIIVGCESEQPVVEVKSLSRSQERVDDLINSAFLKFIGNDIRTSKDLLFDAQNILREDKSLTNDEKIEFWIDTMKLAVSDLDQFIEFSNLVPLDLDSKELQKSQFIREKNLVLYLSFDEESGRIAKDQSPYSNNGNLRGNSRRVPGKLNFGIEVGDYASYIKVNDHPSLDITDQITIMGWFYPYSFRTAWARMIAKGWRIHNYPWMIYGLCHTHYDDGSINFSLAINNLEQATIRNEEDLIDPDNRGIKTPRGGWTHITATYDGSKMRIYYDGILGLEKPVSGKINTNDQHISIGNNSIHSNDMREHYRGVIDEVAIWNTALTESEIQQAMNGIRND